LALAAIFHAWSLAGRLAEAAEEARRRAPEASERDLGLAALVEVRWGLIVDPEAVAWVPAWEDVGAVEWLDPAERARAVFAASAGPDTARDIFVADVALAGNTPVRATALRNLTLSSASDEGDVIGEGHRVAFVRWTEDTPPTVVLLDLSGQDPGLTEDWPAVERWKDAVSNYQESGRLYGLHRVEVKLATPPRSLGLGWREGVLLIDTGDGVVEVTDRGELPEGGSRVASVQATTKAVRGHVAWAVDTVRAWVGADTIEVLEYLAFKFTDRYRRATVSDDEAQEAIRASLAPAQETARAAEAADPYRFDPPEDLEELDLGWPPPDIEPQGLQEAMRDEGRWVPAVDDDFIVNEPSAPATFVTTFLRTDAERPFSVVYLVAWDPRRVTLHPGGGSIEPKASDGETSGGLVPRDDAVLPRLVAAFNGGFQALHGEFGLMEDEKMYLPPKPWGGIWFLLRGGRAGVGTWPGPSEDVALFEGGPAYDQDPNGVAERRMEQWFRSQGVVSFRQNLTPLFGHGQVNPYQRRWWGSSPRDLDDPNPVTVRSSLCWTRYGHAVYFYGLSTNLDALVSAMEAAGCRYGLHLDMNGGNVGWEFYRIVAGDQPAPQRLRGGFSAEGPVPGRDADYRFRARTLFQGMDIFRFPRYIQREPRDYFYLLLERNLPPPPVPFAGGEEGDGAWSQQGLPVRSYPPAMTMTSGPAREDGEERVYLLAIDPRWASVGRRGAPGDPAAVDLLGAWVPAPDGTAVWDGSGDAPFGADDPVVVLAADPLGLEQATEVGRWSAVRERVAGFAVTGAFRGVALTEESAGTYAGAFGRVPGERFLLYAECGSGGAAALAGSLRAAGAAEIVGIPRSDVLGWTFLYGADPATAERRPLTQAGLVEAGLDGAVLLSRSPVPAVLELLPQTEVVGPGVWNPPHTRRIRYFRTDDHRTRALRSY
jgi:hypothetical protein